MYIGIILIISICICVQVYKSYYGKAVNIPKKEIYSQDMKIEDICLRGIVDSEERYRVYAEEYNLDFAIEKINFSENWLFISSKHEVKEFSYNQKNRKHSRSNWDILDTVYYQNETNKIYIYEIPINLSDWESTGMKKENIFE
jgi:hypothetical protein